MLQLLAILVVAQSPTYIERDEYGVPHIKAPTLAAAFRAAGYAIAEDRLWQLEQSRRLSRGRMAEAFGPGFVSSDREVALTGYTESELQEQLDALSPKLKEAFSEYAKGINEYIDSGRATARIPETYAKEGFTFEPWTTLDSAAIAIRLGQLFGRGGAGEIRNLALLNYLKGQPVKDRILDVLEDFAWQNDPRAIPTVAAVDDPVKNRPFFPNPTRKETERHVAGLPNANLFELLPGIRLASREESTRVAEARNVLFKTGSYAVVVSPSRSATGRALLLSGPQMGFTNPSIVHEMSIEAPGLSVVGLDVPGVPGVIIGHTKDLAWGLTSGVADTDDIFFSPVISDDEYLYGTERRKLEKVVRTIKVKGGEDVQVVQRRTHYGPLVVTSGTGKAHFSRRSALWGKELQGFDAVFDLYLARTPADVARIAPRIPLTFNLFYATTSGDIGYHYCGWVPIRAAGIDPRFPTSGTPENDWKGNVAGDQMPRAINPKSGILANWNNKPVAWWPNMDTPAWGRIFRNENLLLFLTTKKLDARDLEMAAWSIARQDETVAHFKPLFASLSGAGLQPVERDALGYLQSFNGWAIEGSIGATIYRAFMDALRDELFLRHTGNFISADLFAIAAQPSVMLSALEGKTKFQYATSSPKAVNAAFKKAVERLAAQRSSDPAGWGLSASGIPVPGQPAIPYSKRGTYIQIVELRPTPRGRNVLPPGVAESGPHYMDQVPLARAWMYKPMRFSKAP